MAKKPVVIATRAFDSQGGATAFFKEMLNRYQPGGRVSDTDALDLASLLERHAEYAEKVGCGVNHFEVVMTEHGTQCFRIVRHDGTGTNFSYPHCMRGKSPSRKSEVSQAFRQAVRFDLYKARDEFFASNRDSDGLIACAVTKERITPGQGPHGSPAAAHFRSHRGDVSGGARPGLRHRSNFEGGRRPSAPVLTDSALANDFRSFHARVAHLDFVCDRINLAQSSRGRIKPSRITITDTSL